MASRYRQFSHHTGDASCYKSSRSQVHMEKFSWTRISHNYKRRVTMLSLASIPLNCNTGMDRDELLKWGAQPGNGHGRTSNDQRGGSRNATTSPSHISSPGNRNCAGGNTIESVWGNLGFDRRFDNQTQNQRPTAHGSATTTTGGALGVALQEAGADLNRW